MGEIKSAFEIAMENVKDVVGDKVALEATKFKTEGKKIISKFLDDSVENIKEELKKYSGKELKWVKEGMLDALLSNLILPVDEYRLSQNRKIGEALFSVVDNTSNLGKIMGELEHFFREYMEERKRLTEAIEQQFAPRLRQKEEELSKQLGSPVKIDPASDPEYTAFLRQHLGQLEERYSSVLNRVKDEIRSYL